jgi:hypothetical protein
LSTVSIYGLVDPRTQQIKYVGKTNQSLGKRLSQHVHHYGVKRRNRQSCWIANMLKNGVKPEIVEIEQTDETSWQEAEIFWIAYFRSIGADLKNWRQGGLGSTGRKLSESHKQKLREFSTGRKHSETSKKLMSEKKKGIKHPWVAENAHKWAKVSDELLKEIKNSKESYRDLATKYSLSTTTIWKIRTEQRTPYDKEKI